MDFRPAVPKAPLARLNMLGCLALLLCGVITFVYPIPGWVIVTLIAVWSPVALVDGIIKERHSRRAMQRARRIGEAMDRDGHYGNLPPEDQEEINISWARHVLRERR